MPDVDPAVKERLELAHRKLDEAGQARDVGLHASAVHEAYYAAFHAAMALLSTEGSEPRTHRGTVQEVARCFVRTDRLAEDDASLLPRLLDMRLEGDYGVTEPVTEEDAVWAVRAAERYVEAAEALLGI